MLTRKQKQEIVDKLSQKIKTVKSVVFADYKGLTVSDIKDLRRKLKSSQVELKVAKKTLIDLALKKADISEVSAKKMDGQIAVALGAKDEISAAKILSDFARKNENLKILGAILEGRFLERPQAIALAALPPKEQSLARLAGVINAPISGFVSVLNGNLRNLVFVLSQIKR